jgi:N-acyl-L-homoserine lactone synthetase
MLTKNYNILRQGMQIARMAGTAVPSSSIFPELEPAEESSAVPAASYAVRSRLRIVPDPLERNVATHVRATVLSFSNMHRYGDLWSAFMRARKQVFVDRLKWTLPVAEGMEFDQYDTPYARWVVIHEYGQILGGVRLLPTTAKVGMHSYMLRDAQLGLLEGIPTDVLFFEAPVESRILEATRLFIADAVPADRRLAIQTVLMNNFASASRALGATHVIGIVPAVWSRWLRRLELGAVPVGPRFEIGDTRSQAALFNVIRQCRRDKQR